MDHKCVCVCVSTLSPWQVMSSRGEHIQALVLPQALLHLSIYEYGEASN